MIKKLNKPLQSKKEDIYSNHLPNLLMKSKSYSLILILLFILINMINKF